VTGAGDGTAKTHLILETAAPVLADAIETDGLLTVVCKRVTNGTVDVTDPVFVLFVDAHIRQTEWCSTNRNYPFEAGD
jgi:hypothetical protein